MSWRLSTPIMELISKEWRADNKTKRVYNRIIHQKYQWYFHAQRIDLYFNTSLASPHGGAWEWVIHSVRCLLTALQDDPQWKTVSHDVLRMMLLRAQHVLNARLPTPVSSSVEHCKAITPSSPIHGSDTGPTNHIRTLPTSTTLSTRPGWMTSGESG